MSTVNGKRYVSRGLKPSLQAKGFELTVSNDGVGEYYFARPASSEGIFQILRLHFSIGFAGVGAHKKLSPIPYDGRIPERFLKEVLVERLVNDPRRGITRFDTDEIDLETWGRRLASIIDEEMAALEALEGKGVASRCRSLLAAVDAYTRACPSESTPERALAVLVQAEDEGLIDDVLKLLEPRQVQVGPVFMRQGMVMDPRTPKEYYLLSTALICSNAAEIDPGLDVGGDPLNNDELMGRIEVLTHRLMEKFSGSRLSRADVFG